MEGEVMDKHKAAEYIRSFAEQVATFTEEHRNSFRRTSALALADQSGLPADAATVIVDSYCEGWNAAHDYVITQLRTMKIVIEDD